MGIQLLNGTIRNRKWGSSLVNVEHFSSYYEYDHRIAGITKEL